MADINLQAGLRSLHESLRRIKALLEWVQLKNGEMQPQKTEAFRLYDQTEADLRSEYSYFLSTSTEIRGVLDDSTFGMCREEREKLKKQLAAIEQQICRLDLSRQLCAV